MRGDPGHKLIACEYSTGQVHHDLLLFIYARAELISVQEEKHFHGGMGHTFISIYEWMVERQ